MSVTKERCDEQANDLLQKSGIYTSNINRTGFSFSHVIPYTHLTIIKRCSFPSIDTWEIWPQSTDVSNKFLICYYFKKKNQFIFWISKVKDMIEDIKPIMTT